MKTPVACVLGIVACLVLGASAVVAGARRESTDSGVPEDAYGRPLVDALGPIDYREDEGKWIARRADGSLAPAPAIVPLRPIEASANVLSSGYRLDPYAAHPVGSWAEAVAIGDVTGDGRPDVVMTTSFYFDALNDYCVFVFPQRPDGTLGAPLRFPYLAYANRNGIALVDLDEDGLLDVVVGHGSGITAFLADGHGSLSPGVVTLDADANTLAATDVDRDGHSDIISLGWSRGVTIFYGDGHGGFPRKRALATNASGYNDHEVGDLTGDGIADLAVMSGQLYATPNLTVHRHNGVGDFASPLQAYFMGSGELAGGVGLGDVTGDGLGDAVLSRPRNSPTWLWIMRQNGSGGLSGPTTIASHDIPEPVEVADMDGDGREDVAVLHAGWIKLGVYLQQPGGGLGPEVLYPVPYASHYAPQGLALGDFTSDGCPDVAIADYNHGLVVLRGVDCARKHTLSITVLGNGTVAKVPDLPSYAGGTNVQIIATPATGWHFVGWSGDVSGGANPLDVTMDADKTITATFGLQIGFDFKPDVMNLGSNGRWVTGYLRPPVPYLASQIDPSSIRLNGSVAVSADHPVRIEEDGTLLTAKFLRSEVKPTLTPGSGAPVTVTGIVAGQTFLGTDRIEVKAPKILTPAAGDLIVGGGTTGVTWDVIDGAASSTLLVSLDDGVTWNVETRDLPNTGIALWAVPVTATHAARVGIMDVYAIDETGVVAGSETLVSDVFSIVGATGVGAGDAPFALRPVNPATGPLAVNFSLPSSAPATLSVYDVSGRMVVSRAVGPWGPGSHTMRLAELPAGAYVVLLRQGDMSLSARAVVIR